MRSKNCILAVVACVIGAACGNQQTAPAQASVQHRAQVMAADGSCFGGCDAAVLAFTGPFGAGVHSIDLGSVQDGVRVYLHANVLTGGGAVQFVTSEDCATWTTYDPTTELSGTSATLQGEFTMMGFDAPAARCIGVRNTSSMSGTVLLWGFGI